VAALAALAACAAATPPASAQQVVVIVNGAPITTYDIAQRIKFDMLASHEAPSRQDAIQELIDEKLKVQVGKRYTLEVEDNQVDTAYANMAQHMHVSADQLTKLLAQQGIFLAELRRQAMIEVK
jgi:peptidyl-prolyl cis-trans isomerase SurA